VKHYPIPNSDKIREAAGLVPVKILNRKPRVWVAVNAIEVIKPCSVVVSGVEYEIYDVVTDVVTGEDSIEAHHRRVEALHDMILDRWVEAKGLKP
jgi:hypothetical protein